MRLRLRTLWTAIVAAISGYYLNRIANAQAVEWYLAMAFVVTVALLAYVACEHALPIIERAFRAWNKSLPPIEKTVGWWWEIQRNHPHLAIAMVHINVSEEDGRISIFGYAYNADGTQGATFHSTACAWNETNSEVFYTWEGNLVTLPETTMKGVGCMAFHQGPGGLFSLGVGHYIALPTETRPMQFVPLDFVRADKNEAAVFEGSDLAARTQTVLNRLKLGNPNKGA